MAYNRRQALLDNTEAIRIALTLERENRGATDQERNQLQKYTGFGGLKCILNPTGTPDGWSKNDRPLFPTVQALYETIRKFSPDGKTEQKYIDSLRQSALTAYYTPGNVAESIANAIGATGISGFRLLDSSAGGGVFGSSMDGLYSHRVEIEKDLLTGLILKHRRGGEENSRVLLGGFEEVLSPNQDGTFDVVTSNIPFGNFGVYDRNYAKEGGAKAESAQRIHNYFFVRGLDTLRSGGLLVFITSRGVLDSPGNRFVRNYLMNHSSVVSVTRLPDGLFSEEAGTEVGTDLVILQKREQPKNSSSEDTVWDSLFRQIKSDREGILENALVSESYWGTDMRQALQRLPGKNMYGTPSYRYEVVNGVSFTDKLTALLTKNFAEHFDKELYQRHGLQNQKTIGTTLDVPTGQDEVEVILGSQVLKGKLVSEEANGLVTISVAHTDGVRIPVTVPASVVKKEERMRSVTQQEEMEQRSVPSPITATQKSKHKRRKRKDNQTEGATPLFDLDLFLTDDSSGGQQVKLNSARRDDELLEPYRIEVPGYLMPLPDALFMDKEGRLGHLNEYSSDGTVATFTPYKPKSDESEEQLKAYLDVRNTYYRLYDCEAKEQQENAETREQLNTLYDRFVAKWGYLNDRNNDKALKKLDSLYDDFKSIELESIGADRSVSYVKSDLFDHPVAFATAQKSDIQNPVDALFASINQSGKVDLPFIQSCCPDLNEEEVLKALEGYVYYDPFTDDYEIKECFIQGNVRKKAERVKEWMASHPAEAFKAEAGLQALRSAIPAPIPFPDLNINLGSRWIPVDLYTAFAKEILDSHLIVVNYAKSTDLYEATFEYDSYRDRRTSYYSTAITDTYAIRSTSRKYLGTDVLTAVMNDTTPNMTKWVLRENRQTGETERVKVIDHQATQLFEEKKENLKNHFTKWLNDLPLSKKDELEQRYNELFNSDVRIGHYDGSHQTFPGLILSNLKGVKDLYKTQKDAIWMLKMNEGGIIDHEVGAGKTLVMCVAAYEMKRLGMVNKPMIIGKKGNINAIADTFIKAYPHAKVLYPRPKDMTTKGRPLFFNKIKNNDWDCVILSHEQFVKIPQSTEKEQELLTEELRNVDLNLETLRKQGERISKKMLSGLQQRKISLGNQLKDVLNKQKEKSDAVVDFSMMGVDHLFIDESHSFKNLRFNTRHVRVAGLGTTEGANKTSNLFTAIRTIQDRKGKDLCATMVSGTTITNSMVELYSIFRYLRPRKLEEMGVQNLDAWLSVFAEKSSEFEFSITNEVRQKERFRRFVNVPELAAMYHTITDYKTAQDIGIVRPNAEVKLYNIPQTDDQKAYMKQLVRFAKTGDGKLIHREMTDKDDKARMLIVTDLAAKMSMDMRLIDPDYEDNIDNKASHCAKNIAELYFKYDEVKGTQFVFSDKATYKADPNIFDIYSEVKRKLVEDYEIPAEEIYFFQEASQSDKKKKEVCEAMNRGKIRVMFGATENLGTGVNAQERAVAVHHLDTPWVPSAMEQRNGRAVRQGNWVARDYADNKVEIFVYAVEGTLDAYKFNLLQNKQTFITQIKDNKLGSRCIDEYEADDKNGIQMNYAEFVAVVSGNTDLLEKAKLERKIASLESLQSAFRKEGYEHEKKVEELTDGIEKLKRVKVSAEEDRRLFEERVKRNPDGSLLNKLSLSGVEPTATLKEQAKHLLTLSDKERTQGAYKKIGEIYGFDVLIKSESSAKEGMFDFTDNRFFVRGASGIKYNYNNGRLATKDPEACVLNFLNALDKKIPDLITSTENNIEKKSRELEESKQVLVNSNWDKEEELTELKRQLKEINRRIKASLTNERSNEIATEMTQSTEESLPDTMALVKETFVSPKKKIMEEMAKIDLTDMSRFLRKSQTENTPCTQQESELSSQAKGPKIHF